MTVRMLWVFSLVLLAGPGSARAQKTTVDAAAAVVTRTSARAMIAVAFTLVEGSSEMVFEQRI